MHMKFNKSRKVAFRSAVFVLFLCLLMNNASAYWTSSTTYGNQSVTLNGTAQSQSSTVTIPSGATAYTANTSNGNVTWSQSGSTVTVNVSGGTSSTSSSQIWNPSKYSKYVSVTCGPQSSQAFPSTYSYSDGPYSGTLYPYNSAVLVGGLPFDSKTATYDFTETYPATATITLISNGTTYYSWYYPSVDTYHYYSDSNGYSGNLTFTGFDNATYVSSTFNFPTPNYVGQTSTATCTHTFHYSGTVTRPDTRIWDMTYTGLVYMGDYDTVYTTTYPYTVTVYYYTVSTVWVSDTMPPGGSYSLSPSTITDGNVTIRVNAADSGSGVKSITLPDKTIVSGASATYTVTDNGTYSFILTDNDGNTKTYPVTVSNIDRTVTVAHPVSVNYAINPDSAAPFVCPDLIITNDSRIMVQVSILELRATSGGSLTFHDVLPSKYSDWIRLTAAQTKSDIALGLRVKENSTGTGTWCTINNTATLYAAGITGKTALGVLNPNGASGCLSFSACCGNAWDAAYTSVHNLVLVFDAS